MAPAPGPIVPPPPAGRWPKWFAFADGESIDAVGLLLVADAFPPPSFNTDMPVAQSRQLALFPRPAT